MQIFGQAIMTLPSGEGGSGPSKMSLHGWAFGRSGGNSSELRALKKEATGSGSGMKRG